LRDIFIVSSHFFPTTRLLELVQYDNENQGISEEGSESL